MAGPFTDWNVDGSFEIGVVFRYDGTSLDTREINLPIHSELGSITVRLRRGLINNTTLHQLEVLALYSIAEDMEDRLYVSGLRLNAYLLMHFMITHGESHVILSATKISATCDRFLANASADGDFPPKLLGTNVRGCRHGGEQWNSSPPYFRDVVSLLEFVQKVGETFNISCLRTGMYDGQSLKFSKELCL